MYSRKIFRQPAYHSFNNKGVLAYRSFSEGGKIPEEDYYKYSNSSLSTRCIGRTHLKPEVNFRAHVFLINQLSLLTEACFPEENRKGFWSP
jgi:hypothetical protein